MMAGVGRRPFAHAEDRCATGSSGFLFSSGLDGTHNDSQYPYQIQNIGRVPPLVFGPRRQLV